MPMRRSGRSPAQQPSAISAPIAILFDVDGTLIATGGAGTRSWRRAFEELHGVPADIGEFSEAGMTDSVVARRIFRSVIGREPAEPEMARLLAAYLERLPYEVGTSERYRVLPGAEELLRRLRDGELLLGIVTGDLETAAPSSSRAPGSTRRTSSRASRSPVARPRAINGRTIPAAGTLLSDSCLVMLTG